MPILDKHEQEDLTVARDKVTPSAALVKALMDVVRYQNSFRGGTRYDAATDQTLRMPRTMLHGVIELATYEFNPPGLEEDRLGEEREKVTNLARDFWCALAKEILEEARTRVAVRDDTREALAFPANSPVQMAYQLYAYPERDGRDLDLKIDTVAPGFSPEQITELVRLKVDEIKACIRTEVQTLLEDTKWMDTCHRSVTVEQALELGVALKDEIARLDALRQKVEDPAEAAAYYDVLNKIVSCLKIEGVKVVPLPAQEALLRGADALYRPAQGAEPAQAMVPMSEIGSSQLLDLRERLAHELAHHLMMTGQNAEILKGQPVHGLTHSLLTEKIRVAISDLHISLKPVKDKNSGAVGISIKVSEKGEVPTGRDLFPSYKEPLGAQVKRLVEEEIRKLFPDQNKA